MTNCQKIYCCNSVNYLLKNDEIIFFNKKLTTFAIEKFPYFGRFSEIKEDKWQRI